MPAEVGQSEDADVMLARPKDEYTAITEKGKATTKKDQIVAMFEREDANQAGDWDHGDRNWMQCRCHRLEAAEPGVRYLSCQANEKSAE